MHRELSVDFSFTDSERNQITDVLEKITVNPYKAYPVFRHQLRLMIASEPALERFRDFMEDRRRLSAYDQPFVFLENCPIDRNLPELTNEDPVAEKHQKKTTYVAEGFLQLYAEVAGEYPISYVNVNNGDVFQDIFPNEDLKYTQSQKALGPIFFHKDLANHFVRPDLVNILGLRSHDDNEIFTTFVSNKVILEALSPETKTALRQCWYHTPFDDLTVKTGSLKLGKAEDHPILARSVDLRFFENRTKALDQRGQGPLEELVAALHKYKSRVQMRPGDFISIYNNLSLHGKEVGQIRSEKEQRRRWSIKTVNVYSIAPHMKHLVPGSEYIVNG